MNTASRPSSISRSEQAVIVTLANRAESGMALELSYGK